MKRVDGTIYKDDETFFYAVGRKRLEYEMMLGIKVPPLVGSNVLIDDNIGGKRIKLRAKQMNYRLIDPRSRFTDRKPDAWAGRVYKALSRLKKLFRLS